MIIKIEVNAARLQYHPSHSESLVNQHPILIELSRLQTHLALLMPLENMET